MAGSSDYDPSGLLGQVLGAPVTITSGFRTPQQNAAVGGVPNSAHLAGQAYDFVPKGISTGEAAQRIAKSGMPFDQVIDEGSHVHLSFAPTNRRQVIQSKMAQNVSDDDLLSALGGGGQTAPAPSQGRNVSDDELMGALGGAQVAAQPGGGTISPPATSQPGMLESASKGVIRGAKGVIGSIVPFDAWLARTAGFQGMSNRLLSNLHAFQAQEPAFQQQYGTSGQVGEALGQIGTVLPAMAVGGEALAPALAGARAAAPAIAPALDFLTGATKGNKLLQLASRGASGALQGASAAALTSGGSDQPIGQQLQTGAEFGTALNTALPALKMGGSALFNALHNAAPSARTALADQAVNQFGIPLRGSQISTGAFPNLLDSAVGKMPFMGLEAQNEAQRVAFTKAVAATMGEDADNLTPTVMSAAKKRIGGVMNDVAARNSINKDAMDTLADRFAQIETDAQQVMGANEYKPIKNQLDGILAKVSPEGEIDGKTYKAITSKGAPLDQALHSGDSNIRQYAGQIRTALDDALQSSVSGDDLQALKTARLQYKNMKTVEDLAKKANIEGDISPAQLITAVKKSYKDMAYSGAGDIGTLAHIGQEFLKEKPSSTTAERLLLYDLLQKLPQAAVGSAAGFEGVQHPLLAATGLGSLMVGGKLIAGVLKSNAYRNAMLSAVRQPDNTLNAVLGNHGRFVIPSAVIAGNRLINPPQESPP